VDGKTLTWGTGHLELGSTLERRFRAGFPLDGGGVNVGNLNLRCDPGNTPFLTGAYTDPKVEVRLSRNGGRTWGDWKQRSLGVQGDYRKRVQWRRLGQASRPGFLCEVRVTDPVPFRVSGVTVNEPFGGR
jgi:hypothetical protein